MNEFSEDFPIITTDDAEKIVQVVFLKMPQKRKSRRQVNCDTKKSARKVSIEDLIHNGREYALTRKMSPPASVPEGDVYDFTDMTPEREIEPPPRLSDKELWDPSDEGNLLSADRPELTKKSYWGGRYMPKPFVARSGEAKEDNTFYFSGLRRKREHHGDNDEIIADSTFTKLHSVVIPIPPMETIPKMPRMLYPVVPNIQKKQSAPAKKMSPAVKIVNKSATESLAKFKIPKLSTPTAAKPGKLKSPVHPPTSGKVLIPDDLGRKRLPSESLAATIAPTEVLNVADDSNDGDENCESVPGDVNVSKQAEEPDINDNRVTVSNDTDAVDADEQSPPESWSPIDSNDHPPTSPNEEERYQVEDNTENNQNGSGEKSSNNSNAETTNTATIQTRPLILLALPSASIDELIASIPETSHVIVGVTRNLATFAAEYPPEIMRKAALYHSTRPIHRFVDLWSRVGRVFDGLRAMGRNVTVNTQSIVFLHPQDYTVYALVATR